MDAERLNPRLPSAADEDADDSLKEGKADNFAKFKTVAKRLEQIFGVGDNPQLRRKVYQNIQRAAIMYGEECYDVIKLAVSHAQTADKPDRYFVAAITRELKVLEFWESKVNF